MQIDLTAAIVSAYVSNNQVTPDNLPGLIQQVYKSLSGTIEPTVDVVAPLVPAVPIRKSVQDDYLVCLEDGKRLKTLKRYLMRVYGLTLEQYRERWGLGPDYPMVAPALSRVRASIAKYNHLGEIEPQVSAHPVPQHGCKLALVEAA
jgi:predicted transcriptional regulator